MAQLADDKIRDLYFKSIKVPARNTRKTFAIGMIGVVGAGKSTVASVLAEKLHLYVASNDAIRRFLNSLGFEGAKPRQDLLQYIAESSTRYMIEHRISHVMDLDLMKFYELARRNVEDLGGLFFLVHVTCPEEVILDRIKSRSEAIATGGSDNPSRVGVEEYYLRKQVHEDTRMPKQFDFTFDSSKELEPQVTAFIMLLSEKGVV